MKYTIFCLCGFQWKWQNEVHLNKNRKTVFCIGQTLTQSEALTHQATGGHVLLGLDLGEVEGAREHQHVDHDHEAGQESDGHL